VDASTRSAVVARYAAIAGIDSVVPTSWEQINNLTLQLVIEERDPELAAVLKGVVPAELEQRIAEGKWAAEAPAQRDLKAERDAAMKVAMARMDEDLQALREQNERRNAVAESQRMASAEHTNAMLRAQGGRI